MAGNLLALLDDALGGKLECRAADRQRARAEGAAAVEHLVGVTVDHRHLFGRETEEMIGELAERGLVALAVTVRAEQQRRAAGSVETDFRGFLEGRGGGSAGNLDDRDDARTIKLATALRRRFARCHTWPVAERQRLVHDALEL